jgi:hypothetical protein
MRILFDIVHPADVLFFLNPIRRLREQGSTIKIVSRHKDVACALLDQFGLQHQPISTASSGYLGLGGELLRRDWAMLRAARSFRPDVMVGFGGVSISHVGKLVGRPSVSFYAADTANLQTRLTWPFISHLYVPEAYAGAVPEDRTTRFPGIKELSYFHPENFRVDDRIAARNGWNGAEDNFLIRTVGWGANHDIGKSGWSDATLLALVNKLAARGTVHISSERALPPGLEAFAYRGNNSELHHLLGKCRAYIGESATMAHEACLLGVPSIYDGADHPGTTRELASHGLLVALRQPGCEALLREVDRMLDGDAADNLLLRRDRYLTQRPNLSAFIVEAIKSHALPPPRALSPV